MAERFKTRRDRLGGLAARLRAEWLSASKTGRTTQSRPVMDRYRLERPDAPLEAVRLFRRVDCLALSCWPARNSSLASGNPYEDNDGLVLGIPSMG